MIIGDAISLERITWRKVRGTGQQVGHVETDLGSLMVLRSRNYDDPNAAEEHLEGLRYILQLIHEDGFEVAEIVSPLNPVAVVLHPGDAAFAPMIHGGPVGAEQVRAAINKAAGRQPRQVSTIAFLIRDAEPESELTRAQNEALKHSRASPLPRGAMRAQAEAIKGTEEA